MAELIHKELSFVLNGILFQVHNDLGKFANEKQVCDLIEKKLLETRCPYQREFVPNLTDKGDMVGRNRLDFIIDDKIILEVKCKPYLTREDSYQIKRYLSNLNLKLGILINFRDDRLHPKRILNGTGKE